MLYELWRIPGVDGQVINSQGYQSHRSCQSYLAGDTRGKWMNNEKYEHHIVWYGTVVAL